MMKSLPRETVACEGVNDRSNFSPSLPRGEGRRGEIAALSAMAGLPAMTNRIGTQSLTGRE
jgi:hypothetical protein